MGLSESELLDFFIEDVQKQWPQRDYYPPPVPSIYPQRYCLQAWSCAWTVNIYRQIPSRSEEPYENPYLTRAHRGTIQAVITALGSAVIQAPDPNSPLLTSTLVLDPTRAQDPEVIRDQLRPHLAHIGPLAHLVVEALRIPEGSQRLARAYRAQFS